MINTNKQRVLNGLKSSLDTMLFAYSVGISIADINIGMPEADLDPSEETINILKSKLLNLARECSSHGIGLDRVINSAGDDLVNQPVMEYINSIELAGMSARGIMDTFKKAYPELESDITETTLKTMIYNEQE